MNIYLMSQNNDFEEGFAMNWFKMDITNTDTQPSHRFTSEKYHSRLYPSTMLVARKSCIY